MTDTCTSEGTFGTTIEPLVRGETTSCYATCTDEAGNTSGDSTSVSTEVCDPEDIYENSLYGDSISDPIDEWGTLPDDGTTTINIIGNVLEDDDEDWYVITAGTTSPQISQLVVMSSGSRPRSRTGRGIQLRRLSGRLRRRPADSCMILMMMGTRSTVGSTKTQATHSTTPCPRTCKHVVQDLLFNDCTDDTSNFFIHVFRNASTPSSCQNYEIQVTNGVW